MDVTRDFPLELAEIFQKPMVHAKAFKNHHTVSFFFFFSKEQRLVHGHTVLVNTY